MNRRHVRSFIGIVLALACSATAQPDAPSAPAAPRPESRTRQAQRVHHVTIPGDLDCARAAAEICAQLRQAGKDRADVIVLELAGDRWRADVVQSIATAMSASSARIIVWLRDPKDHTVGTGQAALALLAHDCYIDPGTTIVRRDADHRTSLAPRGTDPAPIVESLMRSAGERRETRGFDPLLPRLLLGPITPMWAVHDPSQDFLRLTPSEPSSDAPLTATPLLFTLPGEEPAIRINAATAAGLRLCAGTATRLASILVARSIIAQPLTTATVSVSLDRLIERAGQELRALDREIDAIETQLAAKPPDQRADKKTFQHDVGNRALVHAQTALDHLAACEKLLADDPEIQRTPPPGTSTIGTDADDHPAAWNKAFQKRRDRIQKLQSKARTLAGS